MTLSPFNTFGIHLEGDGASWRSSRSFASRLAMIGIGVISLETATLAETVSGTEKPGLQGGRAPAVSQSGAGARDPKAGKSGAAAIGSKETLEGKPNRPAAIGSETVKPAAPAGGNPVTQVAGDAPPDAKPGELPTATGAKDADKAGGKIPDATDLIDPALRESLKPVFRTGKSKGAPRFPTWQEPWLPEKRRPYGTDFLASPLYSPPTEEPSDGPILAEDGQEPVPYVIPGLYGRAPTFLLPGKGRLAWPWSYHASISLENGYDSNSFQVPNGGQGVSAGSEEGSATTGVSLRLDTQWATAHSIFRFDANGSATYFWNRDGDNEQYNIPALSLLYFSQLDKRTRLTANATFSYLSQADYSNLYASQNTGGGDYLTTSSKIDLSHDWARHFSTDTSLAINLLYYPDDNNGVNAVGSGGIVSGSLLDITFGNEFRFATSNNLSWVIEGRYGLQEALDNSALNSDTIYLLAGLDWLWFRHVTTSVRAGGAVRTSDTFGTSTSPYVELSGTVQTSRHSSLALNARYGFELTDLVGDAAPSYRVGLTYQQMLGQRLSGSAAINFVSNENTQFAVSSTNTETFDLTLGLQYQISRHFAVAAQYAFSMSDSSAGFQSYDRSRGTLTVTYSF